MCTPIQARISWMDVAFSPASLNFKLVHLTLASKRPSGKKLKKYFRAELERVNLGPDGFFAQKSLTSTFSKDRVHPSSSGGSWLDGRRRRRPPARPPSVVIRRHPSSKLSVTYGSQVSSAFLEIMLNFDIRFRNLGPANEARRHFGKAL